MEFQLTTDTHMDDYVMTALEPEQAPPFADLLKRAQELVTRLSKSLFFRKYIQDRLKEQGEDGKQEGMLLLAQHELNDIVNEWLVLTSNFELKFWSEFNFDVHSFEDRDYPTFEKNNEIYNFVEKMQDNLSLLRLLYHTLGAPKFTKEDIQQELTRNGPLTIIMVEERSCLIVGRAERLADRLKQLQFDVNHVTIRYGDPIPEVEDDRFIIILDFDPLSLHSCSSFLTRATPAQRKRIVADRPDDNALHISRLRISSLLVNTWKFEGMMEANDQILLDRIQIMWT